ncbi:hypothetical protein ABZU32_20335 [Sphaerisporangium sp. NPDC005288]|uniref:hypothetical protein n=1 Tax=Sphaerisporangium sp. NPDC005288 TaxID=3155114 RepID=UPI0033BA6CF4
MTRRWPLLLLALPAGVATWSGWVGLGELTGFGPVKPLPGISEFTINTAVTLPIGVEAYAAYALHAWLSARDASTPTRAFAKWSALGSLLLGMLGQVGYHLLATSGRSSAPWQVTTVVSCLPVLVLGMGAALGHMLSRDAHAPAEESPAPVEVEPVTLVEAVPVSGPVAEVPEVEAVPHTLGYVPEPLPEELATAAASRFLPDIITGTTPSIRQIKDTLNVGQDKAALVKAYLATLAAQ